MSVIHSSPALGAAEARRIIEATCSQGRRFVGEPEAKQILVAYGIQIPRGGLCRSLDEALVLARDIGYPVAVKIVSPQVLHKTEMGGVRVNIASDDDLREAYSAIMAGVGAKVVVGDIRGVLVEEMAKGSEVIVGATRDPAFGPLIMFGLGGIFVEVLKDVAYRLAPIDAVEAREMIREIRGYPLLSGARGGQPIDENALAEVMVKVSHLIDDFREIKELDLNPTFVDGDRVVAADARIILG
ncbi:MAG: acetate--CoA ligase family protein [Dehalococcoidia bacterium]|nr:acetate--CoA ligase family protein [Dehalococcoidia bacterium]